MGNTLPENTGAPEVNSQQGPTAAFAERPTSGKACKREKQFFGFPGVYSTYPVIDYVGDADEVEWMLWGFNDHYHGSYWAYAESPSGEQVAFEDFAKRHDISEADADRLMWHAVECNSDGDR